MSELRWTKTRPTEADVGRWFWISGPIILNGREVVYIEFYHGELSAKFVSGMRLPLSRAVETWFQPVAPPVSDHVEYTE